MQMIREGEAPAEPRLQKTAQQELRPPNLKDEVSDE
jgi:hypothetical protein